MDDITKPLQDQVNQNSVLDRVDDHQASLSLRGFWQLAVAGEGENHSFGGRSHLWVFNDPPSNPTTVHIGAALTGLRGSLKKRRHEIGVTPVGDRMVVGGNRGQI